MTNSPISGQDKSYGVTLIEIVIAITLSAVILAILLSAMNLAYRSEERAAQRQDISQKMRIITDRLTWLIRGAYPYIATREEGSVIFFSGSSESMGFVTSSIDAYSKGPEDIAGLKWITISADQEGLKIKENVYFEEDNIEGIGGKEYVFDPDVKGIMFEYLDVDKGEEKEQWVSEWSPTTKDYLPSAVKVKVAFEYKGEKIQMPPIIASIRGGTVSRGQ